jgi:hypothetical protein
MNSSNTNRDPETNIVKLFTRLLVAISCMMAPLAALAQSPVLLGTFNNPTSAAGDNFGLWMAALGNDRVLIGAPYDDTTATNAGAVYLFHTNGTSLTTFTNPNPASVSSLYYGEQFGCAIATLGNDRVLIGSPLDRRVYLFTTNGALVKTISSPAGLDGESFGAVVVAFGNDKVLIGAPRSNFDPETYLENGAAYLYSTNGALLTTFSNPDAEATMDFGFSLTAFGSDRVLIGASQYGPGAAYLFSTNGSLLTTITNPTPAAGDYFGNSVAAVGTDRVLVGAYGDDTQAMDAGSVYLFNTNGTRLLTITNPTPAAGDLFGARMAMLGNDRVVINASHDNTADTESGSAYVFNVNGTLLATLTNPAPTAGDLFGFRVAAFGSEGVIVGAPFDDAGATDAGSAYLLSVPASPAAPLLAIRRTASNTVAISWPSPSTGFVLQQNTNGIVSVNWSNVTTGIQNDGTNKMLVVASTNGSRFYRLISP